MGDTGVKFFLKAPGSQVRLHLIHLVVMVHAFCDLSKFVFTRVGALFEGLHTKLRGEEPEKLTLKDMNDFTRVLSKRNMSVFRVVKGLTVVLAFLSEFLLPYYLFNKGTKLLRTNFQRQVAAYGPFVLVTCRRPHLAHVFKSKKELESLMRQELESEKHLDELDPDAPDDKVQEKFNQQLVKDSKKLNPDSPEDALIYNLNSFHRFVSFSLSKAALHGLYVAFHALVSPHNHNAFVNSFKKKR